MMQAGRELDAKVAEALGWRDVRTMVSSDRTNLYGFKPGEYVVSTVPKFSTTWASMGVLVQEARKQGILLEYEHEKNERYMGRAWRLSDGDWVYMGKKQTEPPAVGNAPHAVCLAYLKAKGIAV